ncbi:Ribonuclease H domain [Sesbania bispinosa]|nr:Ribonuclease H domain [Sesbania bispinosa]
MDGSVIEGQTGYGGLFRDSSGRWLNGFFGSLRHVDIVKAELFAMLQGLSIAWMRGYRSILCYSDS